MAGGKHDIVLQVDNLEASYGPIMAIKGVSLQVRKDRL